MSGAKHNLEDGDQVELREVAGMLTPDGESINGSVHKVTVINPHQFTIGDTSSYGAYEGNGIVRQVKVPRELQFVSLATALKDPDEHFALDMHIADEVRFANMETAHLAFEALDVFAGEHGGRLPAVWDQKEAAAFVALVKEIRSKKHSA